MTRDKMKRVVEEANKILVDKKKEIDRVFKVEWSGWDNIKKVGGKGQHGLREKKEEMDRVSKVRHGQ